MTEHTPTSQKRGTGSKVIIFLVILLLILHQDNWNWEDDRLVFGFIPIGLFYHACISIGAALTWFLATVIAWPFASGQPGLKPADEEVQS